MLVLMIACMVTWANEGSSILADNWAQRPKSAKHVFVALYHGISLGFLSTTGIVYEVIISNIYLNLIILRVRMYPNIH